MSHVAIVPARAGSTRLPNKNFFPLGGKPLIVHTLEAVIGAECFDKIIVTTDSEEVKQIAKAYKGVEIHNRPEEFATSKATVVSAILNLMAELPVHKTASYFLPTCPFRDAKDIRLGFELLQTSDSVISTCYYDEAPQLAMIEGENGNIYPVFDNLRAGMTNSKYITKYVKPNGGFYMSSWEMILESGHFFNGRVRGVRLPKVRSIDIDTIEDIKYAEAVIGGGHV